MTDNERNWAAQMRASNAGDEAAYARLLAALAPVLRAIARRTLARTRLEGDSCNQRGQRARGPAQGAYGLGDQDQQVRGMSTDDLIQALAADAAARPEPVERRFLGLAALGVVAAACVYVLLLSPRPDLAAVIARPRVAFKFVVTLALVGLAATLALRLARPEAVSNWRMALLPVLALLALGIAAECLTSPPEAWPVLLLGGNNLACLVLVPVLSALPLVVVLAALRHGAPRHPRVAGAAAGLVAGGIGAALYATQCPDDSPLLVAAWYGTGIALVAALGAAMGARALRW